MIILGVKLQNSIVGMMFRDFFRSYCDLADSLDEVVGYICPCPLKLGPTDESKAET